MEIRLLWRTHPYSEMEMEIDYISLQLYITSCHHQSHPSSLPRAGMRTSTLEHIICWLSDCWMSSPSPVDPSPISSINTVSYHSMNYELSYHEDAQEQTNNDIRARILQPMVPDLRPETWPTRPCMMQRRAYHSLVDVLNTPHCEHYWTVTTE